jgi:hypothetical protein
MGVSKRYAYDIVAGRSRGRDRPPAVGNRGPGDADVRARWWPCSAARISRGTPASESTRPCEPWALKQPPPSSIAIETTGYVWTSLASDPSAMSCPLRSLRGMRFNWTGEGDDGPCGEWLRCLKNTLPHQRQFVWSGSKVAGLVTFSGWVRPGGWGSLSRLRKPVDRAALLADERTASRFDAVALGLCRAPRSRLSRSSPGASAK